MFSTSKFFKSVSPSRYIAIAHATTPFISTYPWSAGFGAKYADPATLPTGTGNGVAFSFN